MKFIRFCAASILIALILAFVIMNRQSVIFYWSPFHAAQTVPLYWIALGFMALGFLLGAFMIWLGHLRIYWEGRKQKKVIHALEKELEMVQKAADLNQIPGSDFYPALPSHKS